MPDFSKMRTPRQAIAAKRVVPEARTPVKKPSPPKPKRDIKAQIRAQVAKEYTAAKKAAKAKM